MLTLTQNQNTKTYNGRLTHCKNGHEFNEENTYIQPKSRKRLCRLCQTARNQQQWRENLEANREAAKEHMRDWRAANKERDRKNWTELRRRKKEWLDSQKTACTDCGELDPACLDFHHVDSTKKDANLSVAVAHWSIKRLQTEMAKCVILCSNCHRKLHWRENRKGE